MTSKTKTRIKFMLMLVLSAGLILYSIAILPDEVWIKKGEVPAFNLGLPVTSFGGYKDKAVSSDSPYSVSKYKSDYLLFGSVPVKSVNVTVTDDIKLIPGGFPFGVKFFTDGVMIVGMSEFETSKGKTNPAYSAGIRTRDIILSIDGKAVKTNEDVSDIVESSSGKSLTFRIQRKNAEFTIKVTPEKSTEENTYRVGLWVRDSTAGIGTITYINPNDKTFAGLGHGICDVDTGELMPLSEGTILGAVISDVRKGLKGSPGELLGSFANENSIGSLSRNSDEGVFGEYTALIPDYNKPIPVAYKQNIKEGPAQIICCIDGTKPETYDITIVKAYKTGDSKTKNMVVQVTDPRLLKKTGGIVQGMSGSPIIQNGHLVGAVTHVLVNDPTRGFGIFIENMLKNEKSLKNAA